MEVGGEATVERGAEGGPRLITRLRLRKLIMAGALRWFDNINCILRGPVEALRGKEPLGSVGLGHVLSSRNVHPD